AVLYAIGDLQASTLVDSLAQPVPEPLPALLIPVGGQTPANLAIKDVRIVSRIIEQGQPVRIEATLANFGTAAAEGVVVTLSLEEQRVAQASVDLPPGGTARVTFTTTPSRRGWLPGVVELLQPDVLLEDNTRYLVLHVPELRRVLLVAGMQARTDYLELALSPEIRQERLRFEITRITEEALPATALDGYDVVGLVGLHDLSSGEVTALARYVAEGGGLLFFPGATGGWKTTGACWRRWGPDRCAGWSAIGTARRQSGRSTGWTWRIRFSRDCSCNCPVSARSGPSGRPCTSR
uniref:CARDB domain-containing protein n=1 Tax=Rhodothermus marinus TaxID=29549 RepID=UPI0023428ADA